MSDTSDIIPFAASLPKKEARTSFLARMEARCAEFNECYAIVLYGTSCVVLRQIRNDDSGGVDIILMSEKAFLMWAANQTEWDEKEEKKVSVARYWITWHGRRSYNKIVFRPCIETRASEFNLWRGFSYQPAHVSNQLPFATFLDHIRTNICAGSEPHFVWLMGWLADMMQKPWRKNGVAVVLRGGKGVGKGTFVRHIGALMSDHYLTISAARHLMGNFNGHLINKLLVFADDAFLAGDKRQEGALKTFITEDMIAVEFKGRDVCLVASCARLIIAGNDDWIVPASNDERRFFVLDVGATVRNNKEYFAQMERELKDGGYQAFLGYLLTYKYDDSMFSKVPPSAALTEQKLASMTPEETWWYECLHESSNGTTMNGIQSGWCVDIKADEIYSNYLTFCHNTRVSTPRPKHVVTRVLRKICPSMRRVGHSNTGGYRYLLPDVDICRVEFCNLMNVAIDWDE